MITKMYNTMPMEVKDTGLVRGLVPSFTTQVEEPTFEWTGKKFPRKLYLQTVAFAKYCMEKFGGEVQGRLYYNEDRDEWAVVILPQKMERSLHSEEIAGHKDRGKAMRKVAGKGWIQNGTWHSHAHANAGQSAVDLRDEIVQAGLHYTVGSLRSTKSSFDSRYNFRGYMYSLNDGDIVDRPIVNPEKCNAFPSEWKDYLHVVKTPKRVEFNKVSSVAWGPGNVAARCSYYGNDKLNWRGVSMNRREFDQLSSSGLMRKFLEMDHVRCKEALNEWLDKLRKPWWPDNVAHDLNEYEEEDKEVTFAEYLEDYYCISKQQVMCLEHAVESIFGDGDIIGNLEILCEIAQWVRGDQYE